MLRWWRDTGAALAAWPGVTLRVRHMQCPGVGRDRLVPAEARAAWLAAQAGEASG